MKKNNIIKIYSLNCPITGTVKYIGKTEFDLNKRLSQHLSNYNLRKKTLKNNWIKNLLKKGLKPEIELLEYVSKAEWCFWEQFWIEQFKQWGFNLKNSAEGGHGGKTKWKTGKKHHFYGTKFNSNKRTNISKSLSGQSKNISTKIKVSNPIIQMNLQGEFIKEWYSITSASKKLNISQGNISAVCAGKRKQAGLFLWKYKNPINTKKRIINRLDNKDVMYIINSYNSGLHNQRELSKKFNVSIPYISRIINKKRKSN